MAILLLRYWREGLLIVLALSLGVAYNLHEHRVRAEATLVEQVRVMDSTLKATKIAMLAQGKTIVYDTTEVLRLLRKVDTLLTHDTLYATPDARDDSSAIPLPPAGGTLATRVLRDSLIPACTRLAHDCGAYQVAAEKRFADYERRIAAMAPPRSEDAPARRIGGNWSTVGVLVLGAITYGTAEHYLHSRRKQ
jgi:hypothetical protein